jgi:hypothetical protein
VPGKPAQYGFCGFKAAGEDQVAYDDSFAQEAVPVFKAAPHVQHGAYGLFRGFRIGGGPEKPFRQAGVQGLEVGEPDRHGVFEEPEGGGVFVGRRIPQYGEAKAPGAGRGYGFRQGGDGMASGNDIDVFRPPFLEGKEDGGGFSA